jgi:ATP-dependent exoDNAse (exonuclease V) beta subunit
MWCQEMPLWIDQLRTAGRVDHIGLWYGVPSVIDYKTSKGPKTDAQIEDYRLQCSFYALAHNALFGTDIQQFVVLIMCLSGEVRTFIGKVADHEQLLFDRLALYDEIQAENYLASLAA